MGIQGREVINPYGIAGKTVIDRLKWDLHPESFHSRKMLREWKDRYRGQSAVILCNGPSLLKTDFSLLKDTFTFGLNKINLLFDRSDFRPSCIASVNTLVIEQNAEFFRSTDIPLFLDSSALPHVGRRSTIAYLKSANIVRFAQDVSLSIYQGHTVTYVAMQLAYHMGFTRVTLVGCDHNFAAKGVANQTVTGGAKDESHFDPRYFAGVNWQLPDLIQSEISYLMALDTFQMDGRLLCNSTEGGKLELLPRVPLADFIAGRQAP